MNETNVFLMFSLADKGFALSITPVERVIRAVEITLLPKAPEIVMGVINYKGIVVPVIDIGQRFHLPKAELDISQQMLIVNQGTRTIALLVDEVEGNIEKAPSDVFKPTDIVEGIRFLESVIRMDEGVLLVPNLEKILTQQEESHLDSALQATEKENL